MVFGKIIHVDINGNPIEIRVPLENGIHEGAFLLNTFFGIGNLIVNGSSAVFKKHLITDALETLQGFNICGDWFLWSNIALNEDIAYTDSSVTYYRKHVSATSNNLFENPDYYLESFAIISHIKGSITLNKKLFLFWYNRIKKNVSEKETSDFLIKNLKELFGAKAFLYHATSRSKKLIKKLIANL